MRYDDSACRVLVGLVGGKYAKTPLHPRPHKNILKCAARLPLEGKIFYFCGLFCSGSFARFKRGAESFSLASQSHCSGRACSLCFPALRDCCSFWAFIRKCFLDILYEEMFLRSPVNLQKILLCWLCNDILRVSTLHMYLRSFEI